MQMFHRKVHTILLYVGKSINLHGMHVEQIMKFIEQIIFLSSIGSI